MVGAGGVGFFRFVFLVVFFFGLGFGCVFCFYLGRGVVRLVVFGGGRYRFFWKYGLGVCFREGSGIGRLFRLRCRELGCKEVGIG